MATCRKCNQEINGWTWYDCYGVMCQVCGQGKLNTGPRVASAVPDHEKMLWPPEATAAPFVVRGGLALRDESIERNAQEEMLRAHRWLFDVAIRRWGSAAQTKMAVENLLECALEMHRVACGRRPWNNDAMIEEIADAKIMLAQLDLMVDRDAVTRAMRLKLDRLAQRLNSAANEEGGF